ncbi:MAG: CPBP family intramembrane metalloprotease, partial [Acidobacteria bacterium]|nr:CPBP family intramembrane metalloprotease [Acidobacteriota bacterium]
QEQLYRSPRWIALFLLLEASLLLLLLGCSQHLRGKSLKELGLRRQAYGVEVRLGMVLVPLLFLINLLMAGFFKYFLPRHFAPRNPLLDLVRTPADLALLVIAGLLAGGIKEEVQRAFILRRFEMLLGSAGLGLALWSAYFGWGHQIQGLQNAVTAGLFGFLFGVIYLWRQSLVAPMVSHSLYDTTALLLYWFFGRK